MNKNSYPNYKDCNEYLVRKIDKLTRGTTNVVIVDPQELLKLEKELVDTKGNQWAIFRYSGNDLLFRQQYKQKLENPNYRHIVLISGSEKDVCQGLNLSYLPDVLSQAHEIIDFDLKAILRDLIPDEPDWPEAVYDYKHVIANNLTLFYEKYKKLRRELSREASINKNDIKRLVLCIQNNNLEVEQLFFKFRKPEKVLQTYLDVVLKAEFDDWGIKVLRSLVLEDAGIDISSISPWLDASITSLSSYLYLAGILEKYKVANRAVILRGLGILDFEISELDKYTPALLKYLDSHEDLEEKLTIKAEKVLSLIDINKVIASLAIKDNNQKKKMILNEKSPLMVLALSQELLTLISETGSLSLRDLEWSKNIPKSKIFDLKDTNSEYFDQAIKLLNIFESLLVVKESLAKPLKQSKELAELLDDYQNSNLSKTEYLLARAHKFVKVVENQEQRQKIQKLLDGLRGEVINAFKQIDNDLVSFIEKNWQEYKVHPRLSINCFKEMMKSKNIVPNNNEKIWVLIFDGMRYDTWIEVVRPALLSVFEMHLEKAYLCALPSLTDIARVSLLAQNLPDGWKDYENKYTSDHNILASRGFNLLRDEGRQKVRITVASETDFAQRRLDASNFPYNILIYNISDDWIHSFRNDIFELNEVIKLNLEKNILPDLKNRIRDDDFVIITSDHGFIELDPQEAIKIDSDSGREDSYVSYRYLKNLENSEGFKVQYLKDIFYTVAKNRKWFQREAGRFARYAHGGISLHEMVVPGVLLKKISVPLVDFEIICESVIACNEDEEMAVVVKIKNLGNKKAKCRVATKLGSISEESTLNLNPQEEVDVEFKIRPKLADKSIGVVVSFNDINEMPVSRSRNIVLDVKMRKDKVEIDTSALERFDNL